MIFPLYMLQLSYCVQVEDYTQQLALRLKVLDNPRSSSDDHHHPPRYSNASVHSTVKGESTSTGMLSRCAILVCCTVAVFFASDTQDRE